MYPRRKMNWTRAVIRELTSPEEGGVLGVSPELSLGDDAVEGLLKHD